MNAGRAQTKVLLLTGPAETDVDNALDALDVSVRTAVLRRSGEPDRTIIRGGVKVRDGGWATERMKWAEQPSVWRSRVFTWLPTAERAAYI